MAEGKKRSPGVDIVLFIVTLGVYWWFWTYKAFHEIAERERRPLPAAKFFPAMIVLWLIGLGVSGYGAAKTFQERLKEREAGTSPENPFAAQLDQFSDPIVIAGIVASIRLYLLQLFYLRTAHRIVEDVARQRGDPNPPATALPVLFNVFFAVGWVPFAGILLSLGGAVVAIIWVVQVQNTMNRYWDSTMMAPPMPPAGWMPPPTMGATPSAGYGQPPMRR